MDSSKFWFNNFKPDVELTIEDDKVLKLLKKTILDSEFGAKKKDMVFDQILSEILHAEPVCCFCYSSIYCCEY